MPQSETAPMSPLSFACLDQHERLQGSGLQIFGIRQIADSWGPENICYLLDRPSQGSAVHGLGPASQGMSRQRTVQTPSAIQNMCSAQDVWNCSRIYQYSWSLSIIRSWRRCDSSWDAVCADVSDHAGPPCSISRSELREHTTYSTNAWPG